MVIGLLIEVLQLGGFFLGHAQPHLQVVIVLYQLLDGGTSVS